MLMLACEIHDLRHFCLSDFVGENAANADAAAMDMEHNASRLFAVLVEEPLEDVDNELHRRVIVVQHQNFVHRGLLRLRLWLDDDACRRTLCTVAFFDVTHAEPVDRTSCTLKKTIY